MEIRNVEGLTTAQLQQEIAKGGRFIMYKYCISIIVMTFNRPSDVFFIRADESAFVKGLPYTLLTLVLGWWGIPWGPIYTIGALGTNLGGGKDVTQEVLQSIGIGRPQANSGGAQRAGQQRQQQAYDARPVNNPRANNLAQNQNQTQTNPSSNNTNNQSNSQNNKPNEPGRPDILDKLNL